uniref:finTRIM family, member 86 isoform X2 n=1 Tax=Gasterosteus aculeatus aculeatus TaxID=481459 RepID=UPI001A98C8EE|nr:finTRIM family, member 86 isoform X2 [Gasterosteus aculeatus aculeatus]
MASAWSEEETFVCSVCLDTLKDPATLPCGHSYCLACIQSHWDKKDRKGQCSCPQCRQVFNPRPSLAKSTVLAECIDQLRTKSLQHRSSTTISSAPPSMPIYLEVLPARETRQGGVYPQLPTEDPGACPQHNRALDLFCCEDMECVCEVCCQHGHKGHRVRKPHEERKDRQKELAGMQVEQQKRIQATSKRLAELPHAARQHKALVQALKQESTDVFAELVESVTLTGALVGEALGKHEAALGSRVEGQVHGLQQEVATLRWKSEELSRLAGMQDDICFLKNFLVMEPPGEASSPGESVLSQEEAVVASVRSAMKELQESTQDLCKTSLAKIATLVNTDSGASTHGGPAAANDGGRATAPKTACETTSDLPPLLPSRRPLRNLTMPPPPVPPRQPQSSTVTTVEHVQPEPMTREEMLKFRFEPTMDGDTVYRHVQLSDGGRKATMRAENLNLPEHPERFTFWRQVLCKEALAGSPYYWEVEWTGKKITIALAYKEMERKGSDDGSRLGHNAQSWSLYWSGTGFSFWHDGQEKALGSPKARRIGVYLDQHTGVLAFYRIAHNQADLIHQHQSHFTGPLFPGFRFWTGVGSTVTVCQLD